MEDILSISIGVCCERLIQNNEPPPDEPESHEVTKSSPNKCNSNLDDCLLVLSSEKKPTCSSGKFLDTPTPTPINLSTVVMNQPEIKSPGTCPTSSGDGVDGSFQSCTETAVADQPVDTSTTQIVEKISKTAENSIAERFFSGEITPAILKNKYKWLDKAKSSSLYLQLPLRRARSVHDILLLTKGSTHSSEETGSNKPIINEPLMMKEEELPAVVQPVVESNVIQEIFPESAISSVGSFTSGLHSEMFDTLDGISPTSKTPSITPDCARSTHEGDQLMVSEEPEDVQPIVLRQTPLPNIHETVFLEPIQENSKAPEEGTSNALLKSCPDLTPDSGSDRMSSEGRKLSRYSEGSEPTSIVKTLVTPDKNWVVKEKPEGDADSIDRTPECTPLELVLLPGKKYRRSISIIRNFESGQCIPNKTPHNKGRHYRESVKEVLENLHNSPCGNAAETTFLESLKQKLSIRRSSLLMEHIRTPPRWRCAGRQTVYETPGSVLPCGNSMQQSTFLSRSSLSLNETFTVTTNEFDLTEKDVILKMSEQTDVISFSDILKDECYNGAAKVGEGVYGEVFQINRGDQMTVVKIIPVEGGFPVNDAEQKSFAAILPELIISKELNDLRKEESHDVGFVEIFGIYLVQGPYTPRLLELWNQFDLVKGSDNDNPKIFGDEQLYVVIEQAYGGTEYNQFSTARQSLAVFKQIAFTLAVGECATDFEHRDLHWGNILISKTKPTHKMSYVLDGEEYFIPTYGLKVTIIDYTLSRISYKNMYTMCCDLSQDPDLFLGSGDYQFDVYRQMQEDVGNDWNQYNPKTNVRWLHYLILKMKKGVKYLRRYSKTHKEAMNQLNEISAWIDKCESAKEVAQRISH